MTKTVALELATFGITCNCISPGYVWTPLVERQIPDQMKTRGMTTAQGLIGAGLPANAVGEVRKPLAPIGSVYAGGEEWTARTADEKPLDRGTPVRILRQEGLTLVVEPTDK